MRTFIVALAATFFLTAAVYAACGGPPTPPIIPPITPIPVVTGTPITNCSVNPVTTTARGKQLAIMAPCSPNVVVTPQPALMGVSLTDDHAMVPAGCIPVEAQAIGMKNVEVWVHGVRAATLTDSGNGDFVGILDLSNEPAGPIRVKFMAWDAPVGQAPGITLGGEYILFVGGKRPDIATPTPAAGMTLAFSDHFDKLSAAACKPGTGTWPKCQPPGAQDGFTWYENLFNGQDFGDCANEHTDSKYNPFTILPMGGLRIRHTFDDNYVDPYGFGRKQYCGVLSSGFKDNSTSVPTSDGYYDARVLIPNSACGGPGNNTCSGGTWVAFWMQSVNPGGIGGIELDELEAYGNDPTYFQAFTHAYAPAVYPSTPVGGFSGHPSGDLTWDWHTVGMKVTGSGTPAGQVCSYLDEVQQNCTSMPQFGGASPTVKPIWSMMVESASGAGWHTQAPPAGHFDYFVDWVAVWR